VNGNVRPRLRSQRKLTLWASPGTGRAMLALLVHERRVAASAYAGGETDSHFLVLVHRPCPCWHCWCTREESAASAYAGGEATATSGSRAPAVPCWHCWCPREELAASAYAGGEATATFWFSCTGRAMLALPGAREEEVAASAYAGELQQPLRGSRAPAVHEGKSLLLLARKCTGAGATAQSSGFTTACQALTLWKQGLTRGITSCMPRPLPLETGGRARVITSSFS